MTDADFQKLHAAAALGQNEEVLSLINNGMEVDVADKYGFTALMRAIQYRQPETAKLLIELGADVNAKAYKGKTPLLLAVEQGKAGTVELLLNAGADIQGDEDRGRRLLSKAFGNYEVQALLRQAGAGRSKKIVDYDSQTIWEMVDKLDAGEG